MGSAAAIAVAVTERFVIRLGGIRGPFHTRKVLLQRISAPVLLHGLPRLGHTASAACCRSCVTLGAVACCDATGSCGCAVSCHGQCRSSCGAVATGAAAIPAAASVHSD